MVRTIAEKTWERMNSHGFWVEPNVPLTRICDNVALDMGIKLSYKQLRLAAKEVEKKLL